MLVIGAPTVTKAEQLLTDKDKIRKACIKAGCSEEHADAFLAALKTENGTIRAALTKIFTAATKKMVGKDVLMKHFGNDSILKSLFTSTVLAPQFLVSMASFDMSVHLKNGNLQLWLSYKKGGTKVMCDVAPPA
jgi:hypothetical protein